MSQIIGDANDVKTTFSSWDACMQKSYCKYPAIVGIVVGSIIVLSIIWCVASCLCCGATLCASCFRCITCFGCCGACGDRGGGRRRSRHKDDYSPMPPTPYNGYQPQPSPMAYQAPGATPQFAQFDSSRKIHDDSLPAMPSWGAARERRIEDHSDVPKAFGDRDVEMGRLASQQAPRMRGGYDQVPAGPVSPMSPPTDYGHFENQAQPYHSDLGAQRLGAQQTGHSDFDPSPLSPTPTYRTNPPPSMAPTYDDRFVAGSLPSMPHEHENHNYQEIPRSHAWSPPPAGTYPATTNYQSYSPSAMSPPAEHRSLGTGFQQQDLRPPSLLQIGRKPVLGSHREV